MYGNSWYYITVSNPLDPVTRLPEVDNYEFGSLHPSLATVLADDYGLAQDGTAAFFASMIEHGISVAAYEKVPEDVFGSSVVSSESMKGSSRGLGYARGYSAVAYESTQRSKQCLSYAPPSNPTDSGSASQRNTADSSFLELGSAYSSTSVNVESYESDGESPQGFRATPLPPTSRAIEYTMRKPVAYCFSCDDMSLMSLYVSPNHRKRGLAERIVLELRLKLQALNFPTVGFVHPDNNASQQLLMYKCGVYLRAGKYYCVEFVPHGQNA